MSYWCQISFKSLPQSDLFNFFQKFKQTVIERLPDIAKENASFSPIMRAYHFQDNFEVTKELFDATREWADKHVFKYRWFYDQTRNLLCMYSVHNCMQDLFDSTISFQNSCDQDYDLDYWNEIEEFKKISNKWRIASEDQILERMKNSDWFDAGESISSDRIEYYRRTFCYEDIWDPISWSLYDDNQIVYLTLFGNYESQEIRLFAKHVKSSVFEKVSEWKKELEANRSKQLNDIDN